MKSTPAVSLLLTNLQLLDYYSSEDAFPISVETFTSLKNKGKAFEHIVHHLFCVYQPTEAAARFQGCWPIYEPVQSRELRNVVFKWLTDLKRSGLLQTGGNVIIRRSLFDDCSGERYEELLLALSTMVLRNQVERGVFKEQKHQTIAYKQCHTHTPNLNLLTPLILAHQSSLTRLLNSRNNSKAQWRSFLNFLKERDAQLDISASRLPPADILNRESDDQRDEEIMAKWKNNWLGDSRWLDILFDGNAEGRRDRILEAGYDKAVVRYKSLLKEGQEGVASGKAAAGLVGLERQVEEQRSRVGELRRLREQAMKSLAEIKGASADVEAGEDAAGGEEKVESKGLGVSFGRHMNIQIDGSAPKATAGDGSAVEDENEYSIFLEDLRAELEAIDSTKRKRKIRPIVTPFRPPILDGAIDQLQSRKTLLPQPASKISKPPTLLPKASSSFLSGGKPVGIPTSMPPPPPPLQSAPKSPKLQKNIFGAALPKTPPAHEGEGDEIDFSHFATKTPNANTERKLMFESGVPRLPPPSSSSTSTSAARSIPRSNSIKSPERMQLRSKESISNIAIPIKSPERMQLRPRDSATNLASRSPERAQLTSKISLNSLSMQHQKPSSSPSPTPSDEMHSSEGDGSVPKTPHRSRALSRSQLPSASQVTPRAGARSLNYGEDEEMTPRAVRYGYGGGGVGTPRTGNAPKLSAGFDDSEVAENIVAKITNMNYSPERSPTRYSPGKATPLRTGNTSPNRSSRFGYGFRSPDVSPIKGNPAGFNVFEHSTLLSLGTPGPSGPPSSAQSPQGLNTPIPHHPSSLEYKPLSTPQGASRLQKPSMYFTQATPQQQQQQQQNQASPGARGQLNIDISNANSSPIRPVSAEMTPQEELLVSEDYSSVFKSRPKVALSPTFPAQGGFGGSGAGGGGSASGSLRARMSPEFMSLGRGLGAASVSGSEDGGEGVRRERGGSGSGGGRGSGLPTLNRSKWSGKK